MATAATQAQISTTQGNTAVFDSTVDGGPCNKFYVANCSPMQVLQVNIPGLHNPNEWFGLIPGAEREFQLGSQRDNGITKVFLQAAPNDANAPAFANYGVVSRVYP